MISTTGSIGLPDKSKNNDVHVLSRSAEDFVNGTDDPVSIEDERNRILHRRLAKRRIYPDGHPSARTCARKLKGAVVGRPSRRGRNFPVVSVVSNL